MPTLTQQLERLRVITTVRAALVMVICVIVGAMLHLENGSALLMTVIILVFFLRDESLGAGLQLIAGSAVSALIAYVLIDRFLEARPLYLALNLLLAMPLAYWAAQGLRGRWPFPFTAIIGLFVLTAAAFGAIASPSQGDIAASGWALSCAIGVAVVWVVLIGIWSSPRLDDLIGIWAGIESACAALLRDIAGVIEQDRALTYRPSPLSLMFFGAQVHLLKTDGWRLPRAPLAELHRRLGVLSRIYVNIRFMARALEDWPGPPPEGELKTAILQVLRRLAQELEGDDHGDPSHHEALDQVVVYSRALAEAPLATKDQARMSAKLAAFSSSATMVIHELERLRSGAEPTELTMAAPHPFRLQPDSLKAAIKVTLGILIGLSIHFLTTIPAGSFLMLGMVIVLVQPNLGKAHVRIRLTLPGVVFGTLYSLLGLAVISLIPHFGLLLGFLALGFLIGGYYSAGPERISFAGIQFTVSMAVVLGMAAFPTSSIISAGERVLGALLAFAVALAVGHLVWPESPAKQLRANVAANLRRLPAALDRLGRVEDWDPVATRRLIHELKLGVQSDFGLLYDFSYMLVRRVRPAYDYAALVHAVGALFVQVFALYQELERAETEDRQVIADRLRMTAPRLSRLLDSLAEAIAQGRSDDLSSVRAEIHDLEQELDAAEAKAAVVGPGIWVDRFARNGISEVLYQIDQIASALAARDACHAVPRTASLVQAYERAG